MYVVIFSVLENVSTKAKQILELGKMNASPKTARKGMC